MNDGDTALRAEFPDKLRFYDRLLRQNRGRLFVESHITSAHTGSTVNIHIVFDDNADVINTSARVVGRRAHHQGQREGLWLEFDEAAIHTMRQRLEIAEGGGAQVSTRSKARLARSLPVMVDKPFRMPFRTKNIGFGGLCLAGVLPAPRGQTLRLNIDFATGSLQVFGKLMWRDDDTGLTGIGFRFQSPRVRRALYEHVRRMTDEEEIVVPSRTSILLVDDDPATLQAIERVLQHRGYGTITATSGPEALSLARQCRPGVILLDMLLPGMNGVEICRALRRDVDTSRIPVVLSSVLPPEELSIVHQQAGALAYLPKPYRFETLATLIAAITDQAMHTRPPGRQAKGQQRDNDRMSVFARCSYESDTLRLETTMCDASNDGAFVFSYWGEPAGTKGRLTMLDDLEHMAVFDVEIAHHTQWGDASKKNAHTLPGLGLRFVHGEGQEAFQSWLGRFNTATQGQPVVIVVDDDRDHLDIITKVLAQAGLTAVPLEEPYGLKTAIASMRPRLVLLDFMIPGLDGGSLCRSIKDDPATKDTTVWLCSSLDEPALKELTEKANADGYIRKSTRPMEFAKHIRNYILNADKEKI